MDVLHAVALGVLQGLTEFLPVSSSGHLVLAQQLSGAQIEHALAFDVALHIGTLVAVLVYFRADLMAMAQSLWAPVGRETERRWIGLLALATLPVVVVGGLFADTIEQAFHSVTLVGVSLWLTAGLLALASRRDGGTRTAAAVTMADALWIGSFQVLGLVPGVSRSGSTLVGGLLAGIERETAARFAFLMAVPAIAGATAKNAFALRSLMETGAAPVVAGVFAAAVTGWLAIEIMMRAVRAGRLLGFALYCLALGSASVVVSVVGFGG